MDKVNHLKVKVFRVACTLGCDKNRLEDVWSALAGKQYPLNAKSMVLQVAQAMKDSGLQVNTNAMQTAERGL